MLHNGKVIVITGGAGGIGKAHATQLAKQGAIVAILDQNEIELKEITSASDNIIPFKCNVIKLIEIRHIVEKIESEVGPIVRLIHCAAIMPGGLLSETSAEQISIAMLINYSGMINVAQTVLPYMVRRNAGDFIVYGSIAGIVPTNRFGAYGATKAASNYYMKVLMNENRNTNIRFQLVCPPAIDTPLIDQAKDTGPGFLKDIQSTRRNLLTAEFVVKSVEICLEKGIQINYPGPAKLIRILHLFFPKLMTRVVNKN